MGMTSYCKERLKTSPDVLYYSMQLQFHSCLLFILCLAPFSVLSSLLLRSLNLSLAPSLDALRSLSLAPSHLNLSALFQSPVV